MAKHLRVDIRVRTGSFLCAAIATLVVWFGIHAHEHWWGPLPADAIGFNTWPAWRFKLFASGLIPYAILWAFVFGLLYLAQIWVVKYLPLGLSNTADAKVIAAVNRGNDRELVSALNQQIDGGVTGYFGQRLRSMRGRYEKDQDLAAVQAMKDDLLANDEEDVVLSFNAVSWAEWALPMLGFLGTVVGIGEALGGIQKGVKTMFTASTQQAGANEEVLSKFNEGFAGLAVAFDTTFLGLIFLLVLGLLKVSLKKMIAKRLAGARRLFFEAVSMWRSGNSNETMVVVITGINARLEELKAMVSTADERSAQFRDQAKAMVLNVIRENPDLRRFKEVLFKPVVQFRKVGRDLEVKAADLIKRTAPGGKANLVSIVPSIANADSIALAAVTSASQCVVLGLTVRGNEASAAIKQASGIEALLAFSAPDRVLALNNKSEMVVLSSSGPVASVATSAGTDLLYPVVSAKQTEAVVWIRTAGGTSKIHLHDMDSKFSAQNSVTLSQHFEWKQWSVHSPSATAFAAGKQKGAKGWMLWVHGVRDSQRKGAPAAIEQILPAEMEPVQLAALSQDEVVILDSGGNLHYWRGALASPVALTHSAWVPDATCVMRAGMKGWLAVASKGHLQMWQIGRRGGLHLYEADGMPKSGLEISGVRDPRELVATGDGRLLLAVDKSGGLIGWEFPVLTSDNS